MNKLIFGGITLAALLIQGCSSKVYNNKSYLSRKGFEGKTVAILPAEVELTGRLPANFSSLKKQQTEESESTMIQGQVYNQYLFQAGSSAKGKKAVKLLNVDQINSKLREEGISLRQSWRMNPDSLGKLLGADMVLRIKVKKNRIMSDAASIGIGVASSVLGSILSNSNTGTSPISGSAKTYNMFLDATLSEVSSHTVITKFTHDSDASWSRSPEEIIESSGRKIVRKGAIYAQK